MGKIELYDKLQQASKTMHNPIQDKTAKAGNFSYQYASLESILKDVKGCLSAFDLGITQGIVLVDGTTYLQTKVYDRDGEEIMLDCRFMPANPDPQKFGSYETYMRRYALLSAFGLVGAEDDDGAMISNSRGPSAEKASAMLADAIAKYSNATGHDPKEIRNRVKETLRRNGDGSNPEALIREAKVLLDGARNA